MKGRIGDHVFNAIDRGCHDFQLFHDFHAFVQGPRGDPFGQKAIQSVAVFCLFLTIVIVFDRFSNQGGNIAHTAQRSRGDGQPTAIAGRIQIYDRRRRRGQPVPGAAGNNPQLVIKHHLPLDQAEEAVIKREIDPFALKIRVCELAIKRRLNGKGSHQAGYGIAMREACVDRGAVGEAGDVDHAAHRLTDLAESRFVPTRRGRPETGNLQHDDLGIDRLQRCEVQPPFFEGFRAKIGNDHVGPGRKLVRDTPPLVRAQIQRH